MRFVFGAPPRTGAFGHSDRAASTPIRGQRFCKSRYSLLAYNSPPRGVAADCATLKGRKSTTNGSAQSQANSSPHSVGFGLRAPRVGRRPSAQARRFEEPQKHHPIHHQSAEFIFGRSQRRTNIKAEAASKRRCASPPHPGAAGRPLTWRLRYSLSTQSKDQSTITSTAQFTAPAKPQTRPGTAGKPVTVFPPEERAQPKARPSSLPCVRLIAAPLSLRRICRRLLGISSLFCSPQNE